MKKSIALIISVLLITGANLFATDVTWAGWVQLEGDLVRVKSGSDATDEDKDAKSDTGVIDYGLDLFVTGENFGLVTGFAHWSDSVEGEKEFENTEIELKETYIWSSFNPMFKLFAGVEMETAIRYQPGHNDFFSDYLASGLGSYDYMSDNDFTSAVTGLIGEVTAGDLSAAVVYRIPRAGLVDSDGNDVDSEIEFKNNIVLNAKYSLPELATIYGGVAIKADEKKVGKDDYANQSAFWVAGEVIAVENLTAAVQADVALNTNNAADKSDPTVILGLNASYELPGTVNVTGKLRQDFRPEGSSYWFADQELWVASLPEDLKITDAQLIITPLMVPVVDVTAGMQIVAMDADAYDKPVTNLKLRVGKTIGNVVNRVDFKYGINPNDGSKVNTFTLAYATNIWF